MFNAHFCQHGLLLGGPSSGPPAASRICRRRRAGNLLGPAPGPAAAGRSLGLGEGVWVLGRSAPGPGRGQNGARRQRNLGLGRSASASLGWGVWIGLHVVVLQEHKLPTLLHLVEVVREKRRVARRQFAEGRLYIVRYRRFVGTILFVQSFQGFHYHLINRYQHLRVRIQLEL